MYPYSYLASVGPAFGHSVRLPFILIPDCDVAASLLIAKQALCPLLVRETAYLDSLEALEQTNALYPKGIPWLTHPPALCTCSLHARVTQALASATHSTSYPPCLIHPASRLPSSARLSLLLHASLALLETPCCVCVCVCSFAR